MLKALIRHKYFRRAVWILFAAFLTWFTFFALPEQPFSVPYSKVLYATDGQLLNAQVAKDHQWRFPMGNKIPGRFETCITQFEDKNFYRHPGISLSGICRALYQNIRQRKIVSGGSTISMQTIRLMRGNPPRTIPEKLYEMLLALRLEIRYSKKEILELYAAHAPFGNNVVGLEAASWRYFGKKPDHLSWSEQALLAVLPNAPGLLYPGRNHNRLRAKRDRLLHRLRQDNIISEETLLLSLQEPIPDKPLALPDEARHYFEMATRNSYQAHALDGRIQSQCLQVAERYATRYAYNEVQNMAIIVTNLHSGQTLAYIGNSPQRFCNNTSYVNCAAAPRSTGSILKPLLYYKCLSEGMITPESMLLDVPVSYQHFSPQNYARSFEGLISARKALSKSLNIPMVGLLEQYGLSRFHNDLRQLGFRHFTRPASHYGLSLILGSGEVSLQELNSVYRNWVMQLYDNKASLTDKACVYETLEAMSELNRPDENGNWKAFVNTQKIAWKTGTSFGNRDAWCLGISGKYMVTVWVGNADGSGRTGLTGIEYAAPVMFDIFNTLPKSYHWFPRPEKGYSAIKLCKASGYQAGPYCDETLSGQLPLSSRKTAVCPYHQTLSVNKEGSLQVNASVYNFQDIHQQHYFILPPLAANYFKALNPDMKIPPPMHPDLAGHNEPVILFPDKNKVLLFGVDAGLSINLRATTADPKAILYWHLDQQYIGATSDIHEMPYLLQPGKHELTVVDNRGNSRSTSFEVVNATR